MDASLEKATMRRVSWRLVPFICLLYFIAFIDRVNIGFAAITMNKDLGFSSAVFGFGAGVFFLATSCSRYRRTSFSTKLARVSGSPA